MNQQLKVVEACKYVDKVICAPLSINKELLEKYNIDYVVHAHDKDDTSYDIYYKNVPKDKFIRLDYSKGISTTEIIKRISARNT